MWLETTKRKKTMDGLKYNRLSPPIKIKIFKYLMIGTKIVTLSDNCT